MTKPIFAKLSTLLLSVSALISINAQAAGYKIPEQSVNATALSAAYVANATGPDSSYYNPAAMVFDKGASAVQSNLTFVHLPSIKYTGSLTNALLTGSPVSGDDSSKIENIGIPTFHYISPKIGNIRYGLSVVAPGGLSKRWNDIGKISAEEFSLKIVEINPTISYKLTDNFSVGGGLRTTYSDGVVKSTGTTALGTLSRNLTGDSFDFGYNFAAHFQVSEDLAFSATYRSKINLTLEGNAKLSLGAAAYDGDASVTVPLPASLALASAFKVTPRTTAEIVLEKTYWSAYKDLDFNYASALPATPGGALSAAFDNPKAKDWKDSNTYRFGLTHKLDDQWTLMGGFAIDKSPAPKKTIGYELPESDGKIYSFGVNYKASKDMEMGASILYASREKLEITAADANDNGLEGTFEDASAILITMGMKYSFH